MLPPSEPLSSLDPPEGSACRFGAGQVWAFRTPVDQPGAKLTILRVDHGGPLGRIVHVALSGVAYGRGATSIGHLPFAESAVEQSVTVLEQEAGAVPEFEEGYQLWREAFEAGKAGVFTVPVAEAFAAVTGILGESGGRQ